MCSLCDVRLLIIGGTRFLGRHLAESAVMRGHEVTLFNRGRSDPQAFPKLEKILGDRETDLHLLKGHSFDAVIDTCGYVPRVVKASAEALENSGTYAFISSVSAFGRMDRPGIDESGAVATVDDTTVEEIRGDTYGPLKALCEKAVEEVFGERTLNIRPGLIVGPWDPTDRFTYWPVRVERGGKVLAPGHPSYRIQFIDARDLADWTIKILEERVGGLFLAIGPKEPTTLGQLLETCLEVTQRKSELVWVSEKQLLEAEVAPWQELPLWIPESSAEVSGMQKLDNHKALASGLRFRPVENTVSDTLDWFHQHREGTALMAGLDPQKEAEIIEAAIG